MPALLTAARPRRALLACPALIALALGGCGQTVSTASFKGEQHEVAQTIANLQSDVSTNEQQKVCERDLASAVVAQLNRARGGCKSVIKDRLSEIDSASAAVDSITLGGTAKQPTASATVRSIYGGKTRRATVSLVKEEGKWKIAAAR
jgi:hypothetical protein